uniref:formyltransferase family protein n=1 Tax=Aliarcobacter sp. TaxID=2321116 RepID=UPI004048A89F
MKNKICLLGNDSIYTKMVCKKFDELNIEYILILEKKQNTQKRGISKLLSISTKLDNLLSSGKYKALPIFNLFTLKVFIEDLIFRKSLKRKLILEEYIDYVPKAHEIYHTPDVNHVKTARIIKNINADIGVFAGVGIVHGLIIEEFSKFCLNAHPAPLPQCRGGGALENTLNYGLKPSASVHFGTAEIDEGKIIKIKELKIDKYDTFNSITTKLTILCAELLSEVVIDINNNKKLDLIENNGKLHYWKDCSINIQKNSYKNLKKLLSKFN